LIKHRYSLTFAARSPFIMPSLRGGSYFALTLLTTLGSFTYGFNSSIMGTIFGLASFYAYFNLDTTGPHAAYANNILGGVSRASLHWVTMIDDFLSHQRRVHCRGYHWVLYHQLGGW
jgi:hypothetical protein